MSDVELIARSIVYAVCVLAVFAGAFWWGWDARERLALKLEYFKLTNRQWQAYDEQLRKHKGKVPLRAELVEFRDQRESDR